MFDEIERGYKKDLQEKRFVDYYWPRAVIVALIAITLSFVLGLQRWLIYAGAVIMFVGLGVWFFIKEYITAHKTMENVRQSRGLTNKILAYNRADDTRRIEKLVMDLKYHNLRTKSDLELAIEYFQSRLPVNSRPNLLEWVFTTVIALSSIVIVTYDSAINTINLHKLFAVFAPTVVVALIILTPLIIIKLITTGISSSRNRLDTSLVQDLAYIYVNFEKYRTKLQD